MAVWSNNSISHMRDMKEIKAYLFQNNEYLRYMFGNLSPEENYSADALKKYLERDQKIATLEFDIDGLNVSFKNLKKETETKLEVMDGKIELKVSVGDVSNQLSVETDGIYIKGERLEIDTENMKLTKKGILSCTGGNFSGTITASRIDGGEISIGYTDELDNQWYMLHVTERSLNIGNCMIEYDNGRYIWETDDEWVGMSPEMPEQDKEGRVSLWANYDRRTKNYAFSVSQRGNTRIKVLYVDEAYVNGTQHWPNMTLADVLDYIWDDGDYGLQYLGHEVRSLQSQIDDLWDMVSSL